MALQYPVAGTGLGTFTYIFPRYQTFEPDRNFSHAESDCVQYLTETGFVGWLLLLAFGGVAGARALRALRRGGGQRPMMIGATIGLLAVALHGIVDVNLHIPANMLAAAVFVGGFLGFEAGGSTVRPPEGVRDHGEFE
jgi:O-antigen ligase